MSRSVRRPSPWIIALYIIMAVSGYVFYLDGFGKNPPGFYIDESAISYNAYTISQSGRDEHGKFMPLYFPVFERADGSFDGYVNPTYVYTLAAVNLIFPPSLILSKTLSATIVFLACFLLGWLAWRMTDDHIVGAIITFTAILTPWFFELSRLVFEVTMYPLALMFFLLALHTATRAAKWTLIHSLLVAFGLALTTYTASIGRFLGPAFAIGLFLFAVDKVRVTGILKSLGFYLLFLIPLVLFAYNNPGSMTGRFNTLSYFSDEMSYFEKASAFFEAYISDIGLQNLIFSGDPNLRHHIPVMGMIFGATLLLGICGILFAAFRAPRDPWYRFLLFGLVVSIVPGALTTGRSHMLRLVAFPVFLFLLTAPILAYLSHSKNKDQPDDEERLKGPNADHLSFSKNGSSGKFVGSFVLLVLLVSMATQAILFQTGFREQGPNRGYLYDDAFPVVFNDALEQETRPIYLRGAGAIHAYYYAAVQNVDPSIFVKLAPRERPPSDSMVLSSEDGCEDCEVITKRGSFMLYRSK